MTDMAPMENQLLRVILGSGTAVILLHLWKSRKLNHFCVYIRNLSILLLLIMSISSTKDPPVIGQLLTYFWVCKWSIASINVINIRAFSLVVTLRHTIAYI